MFKKYGEHFQRGLSNSKVANFNAELDAVVGTISVNNKENEINSFELHDSNNKNRGIFT